MSGFLYYLPSAGPKVSAAEIAGARIDYAFERPPAIRGVRGGPDGGEGVILADPAEATFIGFFPERQAWKPLPKSAAWLGFYPAARPGPADLERSRLLDGPEIELGPRGERWKVPIVRGLRGDEDLVVYSALPRSSELDDEGNWRPGPVVERYRPLWDTAIRWFGMRIDGVADPELAAYGECHRQAVRMLAANYRIGDAEVAALELLDEDACVRILDASADVAAAIEWVKKKLPATPVTDVGTAADGGPGGGG